MSGTVATRISIHADDKASAAFRKVGNEAEGLVRHMESLSKKVARMWIETRLQALR